MLLLKDYGQFRGEWDGSGFFVDSAEQRQPCVWHAVQTETGRVVVAARILNSAPYASGGLCTIQGKTSEGPPRTFVARGRLIRMHQNFENPRQLDLVSDCEEASLEGSPLWSVHHPLVAEVEIANYFGTETLFDCDGLHVQLQPNPRLAEYKRVFHAFGGYFSTHTARIPSSTVDMAHLKLVATRLCLALGFKTGVPVDWTAIQLRGGDRQGPTLVHRPKLKFRSFSLPEVSSELDVQEMLDAAISSSRVAQVSVLVAHYLEGADFTTSAEGRSLLAATLIDRLRDNGLSSEGRPASPSKSELKRFRRVEPPRV